jgi:hypothetical protein
MAKLVRGLVNIQPHIRDGAFSSVDIVGEIDFTVLNIDDRNPAIA